jgi:N-acetylglucosaminyldiphosphoundecaprenol N-acetyl-beta-D-mannosaminyltransferase
MKQTVSPAMDGNRNAPSFRRVRLAGVDIDAVTPQQAIAHVLGELRDGNGGWLMTPNLDHLRQHNQDAEVRPLFGSADLVVADGKPLIWASHVQGTPLPCRVAGSELIFSMTAAAATEQIRLFLLGGAPGTARRAADTLASRFPGIQIVGTYYPPLGFENSPAETAVIEASIRAASPQLVYVGLPFPKADRTIIRLRSVVPTTWFFALGVSFSFVSGDLKRAPHWMQKAGLEWLHRLLCEPRRLSQRYIVDGIPFAFVLFAKAFAGRCWQGAKSR